jgi:cyclopropane-fatty-acyl-phospholipid synthase
LLHVRAMTPDHSASAPRPIQSSSTRPRERGLWSERALRTTLEECGITVGGSAPHDIRVLDGRFYARVLRDGSLGLGESYVDGWWNSGAPDATVTRILTGGLQERAVRSPRIIALALAARLLNLQLPRRAARDVRSHYEIGPELYEAMLDRRMAYSCGYWREAETLDEAQEAKLALICRKLALREGSTLLDIGCGWGSLARYAAERHGARVTGVTISPVQAEAARAACRGLPVTIELRDFRTLRGRFDAVASVGMFEHVGPCNYGIYMDVVDRCLAPDGVTLLHTIAGNRRTRHIDPWLHRYIFPGANLPTWGEIAAASERHFVVEDVHNFGPDYDRTLMEWHARFERAWPDLSERYGERFRRLWRYYLLCSAASFRARRSQLLQVVMTRPGSSQPGEARAA